MNGDAQFWFGVAALWLIVGSVAISFAWPPSGGDDE